MKFWKVGADESPTAVLTAAEHLVRSTEANVKDAFVSVATVYVETRSDPYDHVKATKINYCIE